jgi:gamma-aminobutyric acid type B receptor
MAPFPDGELTRGWARGPSLYPAAVVAAREINNRSDILPGFNLKLIKVDSGCSVESKVTISFLRDIYENRGHQVVGIIGPGCSAAALRVSTFTKKREVSLIHVTPSATSPELEDPERNTTYATISSALSYVQSFIKLMEHNKWNNIATLQDEGRTYFKQTHSGFKNAVGRVESSKILFTGNLLQGDDESIIPLEGLQSSRARVVMVFAGGGVAAQLLCNAFHRDMLFPNFQWIFHDRTKKQLVKAVAEFRVGNTFIACTKEDMIAATNGVILNHFHLEQKDRDRVLPLFQKTYNDYYADYLEELNGTDSIDYGNAYHDAVWAMALALHNASESEVDLTTYTYNRIDDTKMIANYLSQVHFYGMSGPISFQNDTRSVKTVIDIKRLSNGTEQVIGTFDRSRESSLDLVRDDDIFIKDHYEEKHIRIHAGIGIVLILLTVVLIVLTFLLQLANTFWYNYHTIKATSPNITHLVFSGCYLFSIALLILSVQETFLFPAEIHQIVYAVLCNMFTWCFLLGYSLIFSTICTKIWRVYRLFKHFSNARPGLFLSDNSLIFFVIFFLVVDTIICLTWNLVDPWTIKMTVEPSLHGTPTLFIRSECTCEHVTEWVIVIALYKGTIMLLLVALSILNRRIKRKDFRHTRKINILIYSTTMLIGVGMPLYFLLKHISIYIGYVILSTILLSTVFFSILTLFLPPVLPILKFKVTGERKHFKEKTKTGKQLWKTSKTISNSFLFSYSDQS